jgi:tRNA1Val (adenine37-N6)-methyltransferase
VPEQWHNFYMSNTYFNFKQFSIQQNNCAMKVSTDACIFGAWLTANTSDNSALDIGTGTGLLSLMIAQRYPQLQIDALEINEDAFLQAKQNIENSAFAKQIKIIKTDVKLFNPSQQYDFVFSNPPFYENDLSTTDLAKNLAKHSIGLTLQELFACAKKLVKQSGQFAIILPSYRNKESISIAEKNNLFLDKTLHIKHNQAKLFTKEIQVYSFQKKQLLQSNLVIKNIDNNYTDAMHQLMEPYYL